MLSDENFQKLLYDLFCLWSGVQRHYDPPITDNAEQKAMKVKGMICKLLTEIDARVARIKTKDPSEVKKTDFYEEWTMLTWNVLCITSRLQIHPDSMILVSAEDRLIFARLNQALIQLVNYSRDHLPDLGNTNDSEYRRVKESLDVTMGTLHNLYRMINSLDPTVPSTVDHFSTALNDFAEQILAPCIENFKHFCNQNCDRLWLVVRAAQIDRMRSQQPLQDEPIMALAEFYSHMMHSLAVLAARLQGFRYELTQSRKIFGSYDPVSPLSEMIFSALELLMADCVLSTEPSTNAILVTNNLFQMNCGALARGVVFKDFDVQVVSEETAEHIQSELRSHRLLQQPSPLAPVPSAALLAMKPTSGTKRANAANNGMGPPSINIERMYVDSPNNTAHKKSDVNSKDSVTIYPVYNAKNRYWLATYPHLLCTTRQKGRTSMKNSFEDLSPALLDKATSSGKRPIFYFHIRATMFSPSGKFACAHTLSLPFTIATRRNQDCQVQRMMSSYTASIFWLYGCNVQDGLLLQWTDIGMRWDHFMRLYKQHFSVNAEVARPLIDEDFELLQYKLQCQDCQSGDAGARINGAQRIVTFKNMLCPHLRYECGSTNVRFSVWRGMLELLQIFHDKRNNVHKLWEKYFLHGFLEFDQVDAMLERHYSVLIMRLSFVTGGTICFTVKSTAHCATPGMATRPMHLEPLDLKKLQAKCLKDYLRDIADAEKVKYLMNKHGELIRISDVLANMREGEVLPSVENERSISSNVTHSGDIDAMQHIRFTAMRIAVVTCKVKPPSADLVEIEGDNGLGGRLSALLSPNDDFMRELIQLCNFHGKSKQDLEQIMESLPESAFTTRPPFTPSYSNYSHSTVSTPGALLSPSPMVSPYDALNLHHKYDF
ncbi:hypothetical protein PMAYCL1PPCAC_18605 [Pristionchus mayeri]|uniref:Uncharacterized protein n=1 Tax=Pristionchus mayeri TaxID=1317129 RepID=A0AAN5CPV9_9BILA|nr:hypothetical protein PMAYCL1PPCAC_18605 [Pristionchus mayeri]